MIGDQRIDLSSLAKDRAFLAFFFLILLVHLHLHLHFWSAPAGFVAATGLPAIVVALRRQVARVR
jgi:hypothetical protein